MPRATIGLPLDQRGEAVEDALQAEAMRAIFGSPGGWAGTLTAFAELAGRRP